MDELKGSYKPSSTEVWDWKESDTSDRVLHLKRKEIPAEANDVEEPRELCDCSVAQSCPARRLHGLQPARLLYPWDSPGKNTGVGGRGLPHCKQILYHLSHQESLFKGWVIFPLWVDHLFLINSSLLGILVYWHTSAVVNGTAMNTGVQIFL